ncbi:MAG TPA: hypothetical protein VF461_21220 [Gemmatimonadaceae bacterium]
MSTHTSATEPTTSTYSPDVAPLNPAADSKHAGHRKPDVDHRWQLRLLPLMSRMIVGLTIFFFAASMAQLYYLDTRIEQVPQPDLARLGIAPDTARAAQLTPELRVLASLDAALLERRYHQANVFLMGRLWTSYLGFVTGMILALVGAVFILGKLREDPTEAAAKGTFGEGTLRTSSPGIVLAALGVVLMITTIVTSHPIQTADSPVYIGAASGKPSANESPAEGAASASAASKPRP